MLSLLKKLMSLEINLEMNQLVMYLKREEIICKEESRININLENKNKRKKNFKDKFVSINFFINLF
jgi:hypothetical protein